MGDKNKHIKVGWEWLHLPTIQHKGFDGLSETSSNGDDAHTNESKSASSKTSFRKRVNDVVNSGKFHIAIIVLIIIDALIVIAELLFDLKVFEHENNKDDEALKTVPHILHYISIAILCLFVIEISFRIYAMRCHFFHHKLEVFDAIVVVVSLVLDIVFRDHNGPEISTALLVLLRLWRVTRIVNAIVLSVQIKAEERIQHQKELRKQTEDELEVTRARCTEQSDNIEKLQKLLTENQIAVPEMSGS